MSNNLTASFEDIWAREQQEVFLKKSVAMVMADTSFDSTMRSGDVLVRTYRSTDAEDVPGVITRYEDITPTDVTDTAETLTVNKQFGDLIQLDDFDAIQSKYNVAINYGKDQGIKMTTQVDADVLGEVVNAESTVDAGDVGGTAGQGIALTTANVLNVVTAATKKLTKLNVYDDAKVGIVSPEFEEIITQYYGVKATDLGDDVTLNGYFTKMSGYKLHTSNNLTGTAVLAMATNPTATNTVVIQGVTFTFVSSIGTTPGNVLIGGSADATRANLEALINAPHTTTANGVALSAANAKKFRARVSAVNDDTANTLTVTYKWAGVLTVSETLADAGDIWTTTLQKQHCVFGVKNKMTTLVMQKKPSVEVRKEPRQQTDNIINTMLYGLKTFRDNAKCMVNVEIKADGF